RVAAVAVGHHHDDAAVPGRLDGGVERVGQVGVRRVGGDRQVDHADVQLVLEGDRELQRGDHVEDGRVAVVAGRLQSDQVRVRRDAPVAAAVRVGGGEVPAVAGDDARHVRAVADRVARRG